MFTSIALPKVKIFQHFSLLILPGLLTISTTLTSCSVDTSKSETTTTGFKVKVVHMGYQSAGDLVKIKGVLEKRLQPLGVSVEWSQFDAGAQLMEAMNVGKIDIGAVGETAPIFAQASGASLVYIASTKPVSGHSHGIIVQNNSPIHTLADLKGQKVVVQKGSTSNYLLIKALEEAGLKYSDIQAISLPPPEARDAFIEGRIDAWVAWDPYLAIAEKTAHARLLRDGSGISIESSYYMATRNFAIENPKLVQLILEEINSVGIWVEKHPDDVVKLLTPQLKLDKEILVVLVKRRSYSLRPITPEIMENQQRIADFLAQEKIIPKPIKIQEALLTPEQYAAITPQAISQR